MENILLDKFGHIKVTDFGLSKLQAEGDEESSQGEVTHVVGTLEYLVKYKIKKKAQIYNNINAFCNRHLNC